MEVWKEELYHYGIKGMKWGKRKNKMSDLERVGRNYETNARTADSLRKQSADDQRKFNDSFDKVRRLRSGLENTSKQMRVNAINSASAKYFGKNKITIIDHSHGRTRFKYSTDADKEKAIKNDLAKKNERLTKAHKKANKQFDDAFNKLVNTREKVVKAGRSEYKAKKQLKSEINNPAKKVKRNAQIKARKTKNKVKSFTKKLFKKR